MPLGEVFLGAFLSVLFDRLASPEFLNWARPEGLSEKLMNKWEETLSVIKTVLDDAEEKQHDNAGIKKWLDNLRDLAFDLEDIVAEYDTEALRRKLEGENQATSSKAWNPISALFTRLTPSSSTLRLKIEEITERFDKIAALKDKLDLKGEVDGSSNRRRSRLELLTSVVNEAGVFGRETDVEAVLQLLPNEGRKPAELTVIPIHGMGGVGKTTLAQLVYNYEGEKEEKFFELKAWASVSEDFDIAKVTKTILEFDTSENYEGKTLDWLQRKLKEKLQGKRFLVILDDLWNENYDDWISLRASFEVGAPGSTIVVTTRNQKVSSKVGKENARHLSLLSDDSCLSILALHALRRTDFNAHSHLETVGKEIARKCKGLPLAAKVLGGLLCDTQDCDDWEELLASKLWTIIEKNSRNIVPALMLSYHHLPSELKRCFAYCSIFPKDYEFEEEKLVLLWMGEGFILREKEKQMEELGREYFQNLVSRSFFQQSPSNESRYLMHDLINDLAKYVAGDTCFRMEDRIYGTKEGNVPEKARHSSYLGGEYDGVEKFEALSHCTCLRTFLPLMLPNSGVCYLTCYVPLQLLPKLRCLRVLSLRGYHITKISDLIGHELKQLRYLDLSYTAITGMPESTTTLYNLQTLLLEKCRELVKLPSKFANLVNLRHLCVLGADSLEGLPPQIGKLTCLRMLSNFVVGKEGCSGIKELGSLSNLRGTLRISGLENVIEPRDAWEANLSGKCNLSGLVLEWSGEPQDRRNDLEVLDMLQPHESLKELTLRNYGGREFPTWLTRASFPNLVLLRIENCKWCPSLPPVGQLPSLKFLFIESMVRVKNIGTEFYGEGCPQPFRSLETLHFKNMKEWENWSPCEEFPRLREFSIKWCPKLSGELPNQLPLLEEIEVRDCERLVVSISRLPALSKITIIRCKGWECWNNDGFRGLLRSAHLNDISASASQIEGLIYVEDLRISKCEELMPLWSNKEGLLQHLPCLRTLYISRCHKLVSLVANETCLPSTLRRIFIESCSALEHLPKAMMYNNTCLEFIKIHLCHSLRCFARGQLPPTLRRLHISYCKNMRMVLVEEEGTNSCSSALEHLPKAMMYNNTCLESIHIMSCDSLRCFARGQLPPTLRRLHISYCKNMRMVLVEEEGTNSCCSKSASLLLEDLDILCCPSLESLTSSGELPATLKHLDIDDCPKLESIAKSFPRNSFLESIIVIECKNLKALPTGIYSLSRLHDLSISECPNLVPFSDGRREFLPPNLRNLSIDTGISSSRKDTLPSNLTYLKISDLEITELLLVSGLHQLTSLKELVIRGGCPDLVSFPTPEMMMPASLTSLSIARFPNLQSLSSEGLRRLASLEKLSIERCEELTSFPEDGLPPSLLELGIRYCGKLTTFPKNGLPPSLLQLRIEGCALLTENCKKDEGREWSKIAHIPYFV